jgi:ATP-dependent helicase/nuclease subunit B
LPDPVIQVIPYAQDPLGALADTLLSVHQSGLPDLDRITILLPDLAAAPRLRRKLLERAQTKGATALLGPRIQTLRDWALAYLPPDIRIGDPQQQRLILVEALQAHPDLIRSASPWALADDLLALFDDLTLNRVSLPPDLGTFTRQLQAAYGLQQDGISALGQEASLVFTLWHAWHTQLQAQGMTDSQAAYLLALSRSLTEHSATSPLYLAGFSSFCPAEIDWLRQLLDAGRARLWLHGQVSGGAPPDHPDALLRRLLEQLNQPETIQTDHQATTIVLNSIYTSHDAPLHERARAMGEQYSVSPLSGRIGVLAAHSAEQEAQAVDLQVRSWLLAGRRRIGIVTENRRLARRVRALLERADISLQDAAGWALSTTSAAATLERWLECLEEDFAHLPLLDLLNSPFLFPDQPRDDLQQATLRLEQDIIQHENIARGLDRYRQHIQDRARRLPDGLTTHTHLLLEVLARLEQAAAPLQALFHQAHPPGEWLTALQHGLAGLGLDRSLAEDSAGSRLLQVLEQMQLAAQDNAMRFGWQDLRTWLGRTLEQFHFQPPVSSNDIFLLGLGQSRLQDFDALIIAGAEREYLPGRPEVSPFFNDTVRRELGLTASQERHSERFSDFHRLLQSAPHVLITGRHEQDGEPIVTSPWLEALQAFHKLAWGEELDAGTLPVLLTKPDSQVFRGDSAELPALTRQPRPVLAPGLLDKHFSPGAYQQLLDCPYQFYAARCLRLSPPEEIRLALSKADYGERIHQCLQAFHSDVPGLPGPFAASVGEDNRAAAQSMLNEIAEAVFARDLADNFEHHGWLQQWQQQIPHYLDWQIERNQTWQVEQVEVRQSTTLAEDIRLRGQLDRIDRHDTDLSIIDYKTGSVPKQDEVSSGEAVQLPVYALLAAAGLAMNVTEVLYLALKNDGSVSTGAQLDNTTLATLAQENATRLVQIVRAMESGQSLPAWGDNTTCGWCDMSLLCRRLAWME